MAKVAVLFPGQGSQEVGMGRELYEQFDEARQIIDQVGQWTSPDLKKVMLEGPEETLKRTLYTQPAIFAVSAAAYTILREKTGLTPDYTAGHSVGEYGALFASGVLDLESAAKLVQKRAELMENAPQGAMAAILGLPETEVEKAVLHIKHEKIGVITVANYNTAEQYVISGEEKAVEAACEMAKELGAKKCVMLPVGGAFHSPLMEKAAKEFGVFVRHFNFHDAQFPVITNVDAQITRKAEQFQEKLSDQIQESVRWLETMRRLRQEGVQTYIEVGAGKVLAGMVKRFDREAQVYNVFDAASLEATCAFVKERTCV